MPKLQPIQINIPAPCSQDWSEMTPAGEGRFCNLCSRTVIDFTTWDDHDLYKFFDGNNGHVCGRFFASQLDRSIMIPYQPHSRLYRLAVAMGLTLLFTQIPKSEAQKYSPVVTQVPITSDSEAQSGSAIFHGRVVDDKGEPLPSAVVQLIQGGSVIGGAAVDYDGNYIVANLKPGNYKVAVLYAGLDSISSAVVVGSDSTTRNFALSKSNRHVLGGAVTIHHYVKPLIEPDSPDKTILTRDEIEHAPH